MAQLVERKGIAARAAQFAVLTACRSGEVRGARWAEIYCMCKVASTD
jgi:integrase